MQDGYFASIANTDNLFNKNMQSFQEQFPDFREKACKGYSACNAGILRLFRNGQALVRITLYDESFEDRKKTYYNYIDRKGNFLLSEHLDGGSDFENGLAWVEKGGKVNFISSTGSFICKERFDGVKMFYNGKYGAVLKGGKWAFIDKNCEFYKAPKGTLAAE